MIDVSVIVPLRDRAALVPHTLDSVAAARHPDVRLEVIVVDDGSADGGPELVERAYPHVRLLRQPRRGAAAARNLGLSAARGHACVLLDSDDLLEAGYFEPRLAALAAAPRADGAYGPWDHFESTGAFSPSRVVPRWAPYPIVETVEARSHLLRLLGGWYIAPHAVLWRTDALRRVGGQDASLTINQDVDLMFRVLVSGAGMVGCRGARALYREHGGARLGAIGRSHEKVAEIHRLRERFVAELRGRGEFDDAARRALAGYYVHEWVMLRRTFPDGARRFLALARELEPRVSLEGRWPLRLLARLVGPERAMALRDQVRAGRSVPHDSVASPTA